MGSIWVTDLASIVRSAGLVVHEQSGWQSRSNSSGGFTAIMGVIVHHTASGPSWDGQRDSDYMTFQHDVKPVGNLYLSRKGEVWIQAAGCTNTAGKGGPYTTSKGTIPLDKANSYTLNIEAGNDGVGEVWPVPQQDAYLVLCSALNKRFDFDPLRDNFAHFEWAPTRKIDPAGNSRYATGGNKWNMPSFRNDVKALVKPPDPPVDPEIPPFPPTDLETEMPYLLITRGPIESATDAIACFPGGNVRLVMGYEWQFYRLRPEPIATLQDAAQYDRLKGASSKVYGV